MNHADPLIPSAADYVLGLLSPEEKARFERHLGDCPACRSDLSQERLIGQLVRQAVQARPTLSPARQRALMPDVPASGLVNGWRQAWARPLAVVMLLLVMAAGAFGLEFGGSYSASAATATALATPQQTVAAVGIDMTAPANSATPSPTPTATVEVAPAAVPAP